MEAPHSTLSYIPLSKERREIRLLHVHPMHGATKVPSSSQDSPRDAPIRCSLSIVSLNDSPSFDALSYVWGEPKRVQNVIINGHKFPITANLHLALTHLQLPNQERIMWIDAVCINQGDIEERANQVANMVHVFGMASTVIAFLGPEFEGFELMMEYVQMVGNNPNLHYDPAFKGQIDGHAQCRNMDIESKGLTDPIRHFFSLPWHDRVWTIQEYAKAKRIMFQCGQQTLDGALLNRALENLDLHSKHCCSVKSLYTAEVTYEFELLNRMSKSQQFELLLALFRSRKSHDPRDKVYGLLSLASPELRDKLMPDYHVPTAEVYQKVVAISIEKSQSLEVLSYTYGTRHLPLGLPSFVPDWTTLAPQDELRDFRGRCAILSAEVYNASKTTTPRFTFSASRAAVTTPAQIIDVIAEVENLETPPLGRKERLKDHFRMAWLRNSNDATDVYPSRSGAFWRTLCGSIALVPAGSIFEYRRVSSTDIRKFLQWESWLNSDSVVENSDANYHTLYSAVSVGRIFFITKKGYIGWAPETSAKGDCVVLMPGGSVPYVLRAQGGRTRRSGVVATFLGDAYVHGLMHGEVYDEAELETITLI
ncbi:heterokaryon incompatibility protein-domain-containing protein [Lophiotrema nucula]|uniref:Heterokaryon incompatibility protein-domain-containing protein n=1 Tax=Lophiotrema nucula TaxID=690887 RepID=A0A6A5ZFH7_9PLEO|nr:heterokaryon incompatibility protein-domain-containing protein [Lophiotrema nucula]